MDLQTLSTLDDLMSDILLDGINLWFQTHKMNKDYRPLRLPPGKVLDIIQRRVIVDRKVPEAVKDLLEHARRYFNIYLPTAGFEISQTDRYSAVTNKSEACVIANRPFEVGFELRYCAGTIAILNEQEERDLENRTSDFSVIKTSRKGTCLFLGPARFVNHDCDPNCSFMSAGANVIYFKVLKTINVNDEITTHYGDNYFGTKNQECLCATCERLCQGGYKKSKGVATETPLSPTLKPVREGPPSRRLRNRQNVNYYPTLLSRPAPKQTPTQLQTPPKTTSPPVESDTIPSTSGPLTPISQRDSESAELDQTEQVEENNRDLSNTIEADTTVDNSSSYDRECELMLAASMKLLLVSEPGPEHEPEPEPEFSSVARFDEDTQQTEEPINYTAADINENVESDSQSTENPSLSPKNFRMSIDFLCHSSARAPALNVSHFETEEIDNRGLNDASERESEADIRDQSPKSDNRASTKEAVDPLRCENCKDAISKHELSPTSTCRRCHRHFLIYGVPWPSRSNQAIVSRLRKAEREAAKVVQNALEAERLKKKKLAADAARLAAKMEAKAKQEQLKMTMKAGAIASGQGRAKSIKKKNPKSFKSGQIPREQSGFIYDPSMIGSHYPPQGIVMPYPPGTYSYSLNDPTSRGYDGQRYDTFSTDYDQALSAQRTRDPLKCDFSAIITNDHPFHHAPYVVFVDPQDENGDPNYWWIAVTVPRSQMLRSMPDLGVRDDGTVDPDLIVVRFLEDYKYAVCNISGLKLFHPDQEPYRGFVNTYGRDFIKNLGVKRALAFLNGDIPTELQWGNMCCDNQLSFPELVMITRRIQIQIEDEQFRVQQLRNRQLHYQTLYQQYQEGPDPLMSEHSLEGRQGQDELYRQDCYSPQQLQQQQYRQQYQQQWSDQDHQLFLQQQYQQQHRIRFQGMDQSGHFVEEDETNTPSRRLLEYDSEFSFQNRVGNIQHSDFDYISQNEHHIQREKAQFSTQSGLSPQQPVKRRQGGRGKGKKTLEKELQKEKELANQALKSNSKQKKSRAKVEVPPSLSSEELVKPKTKKKSKLSSVLWWKTSITSSRSARIKPRSENESPRSYLILPSISQPRFKSLSDLIKPQSLSQVSPLADDPFNIEYQLLEWRILEGMQDESGNNIDNSSGTKSARQFQPGATSTKSVELKGLNSGNRSEVVYVGLDGSEALSLPPSCNTSALSSLLPSTACSVLGDDEQGVGDNTKVITTAGMTKGVSDPRLTSKKRSHKRSAPSTIPDASINFALSTASSMEKDSRVGNKRKKTKKSSQVKTTAVSLPNNSTSPSTSERASSSSRPSNPKSRPQAPRTELERLQQWTIKNSLPREGAGTLRSRSIISQQSHRPIAPLKKPIKTELEKLREWTILNSLPEGDTGDYESALSDKLTTRSGRKRSMAQMDGAAILEESVSSKRIRVDDSSTIPLFAPEESLSSVTASIAPAALKSDSVITRPSALATSKSVKKNAAQQPTIDTQSTKQVAAADESLETTDLASVLAENKELQKLTLWAIKDSMIPFDLGSSVRSVRSRTKAIAQVQPSEEASTTKAIVPNIASTASGSKTNMPNATSTIPETKTIVTNDKSNASITGTSTTNAKNVASGTAKDSSGSKRTKPGPEIVILHIPQLKSISGILGPSHEDVPVEISEKVPSKKGKSKSKSTVDDSTEVLLGHSDLTSGNGASDNEVVTNENIIAITKSKAKPSKGSRKSKGEEAITSTEAAPVLSSPDPGVTGDSGAMEQIIDAGSDEKTILRVKQKSKSKTKSSVVTVVDEALAVAETLPSVPINSTESTADSSADNVTNTPIDTKKTEETEETEGEEVAQVNRDQDNLKGRSKKTVEPAEASASNNNSHSSSLAINRTRRSDTVKKPNTAIPKFKVGDEVEAPAERNELYDAQIRAIRDHKKLQDVYEYHVHYHGYQSRFDAWIEERLLVPRDV
ncbi:Histone-lysine N-methyltransferase set9 [Haplosporangium sp. Z 27]|nr:Histone-lysine N-methyltransferase set9 [Haplosporangium sp. Z 27]